MPSFPAGHRYRKLNPTLRERFKGAVHKVTLRAGFGCPNRDGRAGKGGCLFCSEKALLPNTGLAEGPIEQQIEAGLHAIQKRRGASLALAYFQDGTATDAPLELLSKLYRSALEHPNVVALAVGTRPDWIRKEVFDLLEELQKIKPVILELGLQVANDDILRAMNRNHTVQQFSEAATTAKSRGLEIVAHVILDLPDENENDRIQTAELLNRLGIDGVKIHNLHILRDTPLESLYREGKVRVSSLSDYVEMAASFIERLRPEMVIHRLTGEGPNHLMLAPDWVREKSRAIREIEKALEARDGFQGKHEKQNRD
jgi:uncharacterized protein